MDLLDDDDFPFDELLLVHGFLQRRSELARMKPNLTGLDAVHLLAVGKIASLV